MNALTVRIFPSPIVGWPSTHLRHNPITDNLRRAHDGLSDHVQPYQWPRYANLATEVPASQRSSHCLTNHAGPKLAGHRLGHRPALPDQYAATEYVFLEH